MLLKAVLLNPPLPPPPYIAIICKNPISLACCFHATALKNGGQRRQREITRSWKSIEGSLNEKSRKNVADDRESPIKTFPFERLRGMQMQPLETEKAP